MVWHTTPSCIPCIFSLCNYHTKAGHIQCNLYNACYTRCHTIFQFILIKLLILYNLLFNKWHNLCCKVFNSSSQKSMLFPSVVRTLHDISSQETWMFSICFDAWVTHPLQFNVIHLIRDIYNLCCSIVSLKSQYYFLQLSVHYMIPIHKRLGCSVHV